MSNTSINLKPIPRTAKLRKKEAESLERYLSYIERNKLRFVVHIIENTNPNISVSNLNYIYGVTNKYEYSNKELSDLKTQELLDYQPLVINSLAVEPIDAFLNELSLLTDREIDIIFSRPKNITFKVIGNRYNLTKQRIDQIEISILDRLFKIAEDIFIHYGNKESYLNLDDLIGLSDDHLKVINYLYSKHKKFDIDKITSKIVINTEELKKLENNIKILLTYDFINLADIESFIYEQREEGIYHLEVEDVETYLSLNKFKYVDTTWVNTKLVATPYIYVIENYFLSGIKLKQNIATKDYEEMISIGNDLFGLSRDSEYPRALMSRLREKLIAIDRSIYVSENKFKYNISTIDNILNELIDSSDKGLFYFNEIFEMYKEKLIEAGIHNRYSLANAINRTPYNKYTDRDKIIFASAKEQSFYQLLNKYVLDHGNVVTMKELKKEFVHFPEVMIYQNIHGNTKIVDWGHAKYIHISNIPNASEFRTNEVDKILKNNKYMVFDKFIKLFTKNNNIIEYGITRNYDINKLFDSVFPDKYIYRDGFIWDRKFENLNNIQRLFNYLNKDEKSSISINEVKNFASNNKLDYDSSRGLIRTLEENFIRKNKKEYYSYNTEINELHLQNLENEIKELLNDEVIVTVDKVYEKCYLPTDEILWTKETVVNVIRNILNNNLNFHPVGVDKLLSSQGLFSFKDKDNLLDVIFGYFKDVGLDEVDENELEKFMIDNNVSNFGIPREFYLSEYYSKKDGCFNF